MARIAPIEPAIAQGKAKILLDGVRKKLGATPNILKSLANAPAALAGYLDLSQALGTGKLDAATREAIALTVAGANECDYCASAHSFISKSLDVADDEIALRLDGQSKDARLAAILTFASLVVQNRGHLSDRELADVRLAGVTDEEITEIIANVALNILTNYFNHIADTEIDFPRVDAPRVDAPRQAA